LVGESVDGKAHGWMEGWIGGSMKDGKIYGWVAGWMDD
jgi:hypothetical protein